MSTTKKITKRDNFAAISAILTAAEADGYVLPEGITFAGLTDFIDHEVELLDKKAESAAKRASEKKAIGDALREKVLNALSTDDFMTLQDIVTAVNDPDASPAMITSRLTQLGEKGTKQVEKTQITVEASTEGGKSRKATAYRRIG